MPGSRRPSLCAALALLALAGTCAAQDESEDPDRSAELAEEAASLAAAHTAAVEAARIQDMESSGLARSESRFGLEVLRQFVSAEPSANHLVAPLGAFVALNLAAEGASPPVRAQLDAVLHVQDLDRPSLRRALGTLRASLLGCRSAQIDVASSIWLGKDLEASPDFVTVAVAGYGATVSRLDFTSPEAVTTINAWAAAGTRGAIPQAIHAVAPDRTWLLTTLTSVSATWEWHFSPEESKPQAFTDAAGRVTQPVMMHEKQVFPYEHDSALGAQIVGLACMPEITEGSEGRPGCIMYVVLPDANRTLATVLERLSDGPLRWRLAQLAPQSGEVTLPRFKTRSEVPMTDALQRLGLTEAMKDSALPGIARGASLGLDLVESNSIIVDEDGPRAASVDVVTFFGLDDQPPAFSFIADRPFIFILADEATGAMLFAGVMADPE